MSDGSHKYDRGTSLTRRLDPETVEIPWGQQRWTHSGSGRPVLRCQAPEGRPWDPDDTRQCLGKALIKYGSLECWQHGGRDAKRRALDESAGLAIRTIVDIAADEDAKDADRLRAAENILDRTGFGKQLDVSVETVRSEIVAKLQGFVGETVTGEVVEPDEDE